MRVGEGAQEAAELGVLEDQGRVPAGEFEDVVGDDQARPAVRREVGEVARLRGGVGQDAQGGQEGGQQAAWVPVS